MKLSICPLQEQKVFARYKNGLKAGRKARGLGSENLADKYNITIKAVRRIAACGIEYAKGSRAYQDIPHETLTALWRDIKEREKQRNIRFQDGITTMAKELGVCSHKLRGRMDYLFKREFGKRHVPACRVEPLTKSPSHWFFHIPATNPGQSQGYYGHG